MNDWTAIIPLNLGRDCKTRLAGRLSRAERDQLVEAMARHVITQVRVASGVGAIHILSPEKPSFAGVHWLKDRGCGLNEELAAAMASNPVIIIHADLPLLETAEVEAVLNAAQRSGAAIATDRAGTGTNALALSDASDFVPAFGKGSFHRHRMLLPHAGIVERAGLALDVDTPEDLDLVRHRWPDMKGGR